MMESPSPTKRSSKLPSHRRRSHSERCILARSIASHWISLAMGTTDSLGGRNGESCVTLMETSVTVSTSVSTEVNASSHLSSASAHCASHPAVPSFLEAALKKPTSSTATVDDPGLPQFSTPPAVVAAFSSHFSQPYRPAAGPLVPVDECLHQQVVSILQEIAHVGALLLGDGGGADALQHSLVGSTCSNTSSPSAVADAPATIVFPSDTNSSGEVGAASAAPPLADPGARNPVTMQHWKGIKEKLLHLRSQIRNRDDFDCELLHLFGDEWTRTVQVGSAEDSSDHDDNNNVESHGGGEPAVPNGHRSTAHAVGAGTTPLVDSRISKQTGGHRRTPNGSTAPPSPIGAEVDASPQLRMGGSPPPILEASLATRSTTPPLHPTASTSRHSPPPNLSTPQGQTSAAASGQSPVGTPSSHRPNYHLETRDEMLRRRNNSLGSSTTSLPYAAASYPSAAAPLPTTGGGVAGSSTPKSRSLSNSPLMGPAMTQFGPPLPSLLGSICPFDYIMVLDFEATCDEHMPSNFLHEIIEFPVVVVDVQMRRVCMEFHSFVRPLQHPILSPFCKQLTGIRQEDVDVAPTLPEVLRRFEAWYKNAFSPQARVIFATDGPWDMRDFMYNHSYKRQGIQFPPMFFQWIDVKTTFANFFHTPRQKIVKMLEYLGLPLEGRLHSGLDDSRNIAQIVIGLLIRGCSMCDLDRIPYIGAPHSIDSTT